ncbi:unnamed protein product [Malus baccata var. baccata]
MEEERARKKLLILYATQTRNALDVAERVGREAERRGCPVHLLSLKQYDARCLAQECTVIFVVSTTGQGDTPDPMKGFWKDLLQKNLTRQWLEGLGYAVFGLGDSGYQKFNFVAKKLDRRLLDLGATPIVQRDLNHMALQIERAHRASPLKFSLDRPDCILKLVKNEPLTKSGCKDKEVHHFEFEFVSSPIPYEVGDVLEVLPSQNPAAVDAFILRCNLDPESFITVHPSEMENQLPDTCVYVPVWFQKGSLPPLRPSLPLILIGPGTGCAPFCEFVEERAIQSLTESTGPVIFFFGCRNEDNDFMYKDFWLSNSQDGGVLSEAKGGGFFCCLPRDQSQKVYVQDKMREHSQKLWKLLMEGAAIYVAAEDNNLKAGVLLRQRIEAAAAAAAIKVYESYTV